MGARDPLEVLRQGGLTVSTDGASLRVTPASLLTDSMRSLVREQKAAIIRALTAAPCDRWAVHFADREPLELILTEPIAHAATLARYPTAVAVEPIAKRSVRATPEQARELRELVGIVAADWPADEQAEALAVALADPVDALTCFRELVAEIQERERWAPFLNQNR